LIPHAKSPTKQNMSEKPLTPAQEKKLKRIVEIGIKIMPKFSAKPNPNKK